MSHPLPLVLLACAAITAPAAAETVRQLDAHAHGVAALSLALDGDQLLIELEAPAANIVGFEHATETDQERAAVADAKAVLGDPTQLFALPSEAGCETTASQVAWSLDVDGHHDHDDEHGDEHAAEDGHDDHGDEHAEETHSEFATSYAFRCAEPDALRYVDVLLFERFPGNEEITAQAITPGGQYAQTLTAAAARLEL